MPSYVRRAGDMKYRKVSIQSEVIPAYKEFAAPGEVVQYTDMQVVEVLRDNGSSELFYEPGVTKVNAAPGGANRLLLDSNVPTVRLWMRRTGGTGIPYKVPDNLPISGNSKEFRVPCGVQGVELFGDKYFQMIFTF